MCGVYKLTMGVLLWDGLNRCNNVLWIKGANQGENGDVAMKE